MTSDILIYIIFGVFLAILSALIYLRDAQSARKFGRYEKILDALIKENYIIKKALEGGENLPRSNFDYGTGLNQKLIHDQIEDQVNRAISQRVIPMLQSLKNLEDTIDKFQDEQEDRMYNLEERTKNISKITPPNFDREENRIVDLFRSGKSQEEIAREMRMSVGRINMILKIHKAI
nr:hypothetical protein [Campylobacter sp.]